MMIFIVAISLILLAFVIMMLAIARVAGKYDRDTEKMYEELKKRPRKRRTVAGPS